MEIRNVEEMKQKACNIYKEQLLQQYKTNLYMLQKGMMKVNQFSEQLQQPNNSNGINFDVITSETYKFYQRIRQNVEQFEKELSNYNMQYETSIKAITQKRKSYLSLIKIECNGNVTDDDDDMHLNTSTLKSNLPQDVNLDSDSCDSQKTCVMTCSDYESLLEEQNILKNSETTAKPDSDDKGELAEDSRIEFNASDVLEVQRENAELLMLLIDKSPSEEEAYQALRLLEESDEEDESDSSMSSMLWSDRGSNVSDVSDRSEDEKYTQRVSVTLQRVDSLNDTEIDKLCDLHNLNKKKCRKLMRKSKKYKRLLNLMSDSDSSTDSDDTDSCGKDHQEDFQPRHYHSDDEYNAKAEADMICANFSNDDEDSMESNLMSSDDSCVIVPPKKRKLNDGDDSKEKSKVRSLWTDSESSQSDHDVRKEPETVFIPSDDSSEAVTNLSYETSDNSDIEFFDSVLSTDGASSSRKNIRRVIKDEDLNLETQLAKEEENRRILRLEEYSKSVDLLMSSQNSYQHGGFVLDVDLDSGSPLVTVNPELSHKLKDHQKAGVKFMWDACYESVAIIKDKTKSPTGCVLAHCMGLGKTFQVITLVHTLFQHTVTNTKHVLVVCPLSTVMNWKREFDIAFDLIKPKEPGYKIFYLMRQSPDDKYKTIRRWRNQNGVLLVGYEAYTALTCDKANLLTGDRFEFINQALVKPGPDLIVCDEGHLIKNSKARRTKALMGVGTKRRIVLTGTPLQNNLAEYYHMVTFVKPRFLGTLREYTNRFVNPIMNGQYNDSTVYDIYLMKKRTHVLNQLLKKTVQRVDYSVLKQYLPEIHDYTLYIKLHQIQMNYYKRYLDTVTIGHTFREGFWNDFNVIKYICMHPHILDRVEDKPAKKSRVDDVIEMDDDPDVINQVKDKWWRPLSPLDVSVNPEYGSKFVVIGRILDEALAIDDKVLIFSGSRLELDLIEHFLRTKGTARKCDWSPHVDYLRMDGTVSTKDRVGLCDKFNDPKLNIKAFLLSHKVGGLGLNLTAANRVIIASSNFNPCHDSQSIFRVYRFGQKKPCYVYRLVALGTMEETIYQKCIVKLAVAGTVVDRFHIARHYRSNAIKEMYQYNFDVAEQPLPIVPIDNLLAKLLQSNKQQIFKYLVHQDLLENRPEEELPEEDKQLAWDEFNSEEARRNQPLPQIQSGFSAQPHSDIVTTKASSSAISQIPKLRPQQFTHDRFVPNQQRRSKLMDDINKNTLTANDINKNFKAQSQDALIGAHFMSRHHDNVDPPMDLTSGLVGLTSDNRENLEFNYALNDLN